MSLIGLNIEFDWTECFIILTQKGATWMDMPQGLISCLLFTYFYNLPNYSFQYMLPPGPLWRCATEEEGVEPAGVAEVGQPGNDGGGGGGGAGHGGGGDALRQAETFHDAGVRRLISFSSGNCDLENRNVWYH